MDEGNGLNRKAKKYLKKLITDTPKTNEAQKIINAKTQKLQEFIQTGDIAIQANPQKLQNLLLKKEDLSSIRFYLSTDRSKNQERFQEMKKLRQQYSHQKTSLVVQEVQKKIKDWTLKQQIADKKRLQYFQEKLKQEQQIMEKTKIEKKSWRKMQQINHHEQVLKRLQKLKQKKEQREEELKESQVKSRKNMDNIPLYIQIQQEQKQKQYQQQKRAKSMSKKYSTSLQSLKIKQHQKKYIQKIKQREQRRQKALSSLSRVKTPSYKTFNDSRINVISEVEQHEQTQTQSQSIIRNVNKKVDSPKQFVKYIGLSEELRRQEELKRQRRKQFFQKIKELKSDEKTLQRIRTKNSQKKIMKERQKNESQLKLIPKPIKIGNDYLKQVAKLKQKKIHKIHNSVSLPIIQPAAPRYKNYLTQFKQQNQKIQKTVDQVQRVKRKYKEPQQLMEELNKKSQGYQGTILKKIKQLQKTKKYDQQIKKQVQIDDLFYKSLKMRLACLQIS